ncbi:MAG: RNA-binding cell elongation regulator Jag/EloR [Fimbriimonadaceae bacterium]
MQVIELTANSVEAATKEAAEKLGVSPDQLTVTVLQQKKGLFGGNSVTVRAEIASSKPEAPKKGRAAKEPKASESEPETVAEPAAEPEAPAKKPRARKAKTEETPIVATATETGGDDEGERVAEVEATLDDAEQIALALRELLAKTGMDLSVRVVGVNGRYANIELDGKDVGHLIGKHGEVLNALQYLTNIMVTQRFKNGVRVTLDGGNYRQRREASLKNLAERIASEVRARGQEAVLDALPAFERRIIHKALSEMEGVTTYSEGEEPNRCVVIAPAD